MLQVSVSYRQVVTILVSSATEGEHSIVQQGHSYCRYWDYLVDLDQTLCF